MRWLLILVIVVVVLTSPPALADITGTASVIDGDTIEIHGQRIRFHGIDAPESEQTCLANGERWRCGQKAAFALADFIGRSPVRCEEQGVDQYGRVIATCYVRGEDIERWMVLNGWALAYRQYSTDYVGAEVLAEAAQAGIWRGEFIPPWEWRRGARLGEPTGIARDPLPAPSVTEQPQTATCCKICRKGKACGNSCISRAHTCRKPPGCACNAY